MNDREFLHLKDCKHDIKKGKTVTIEIDIDIEDIASSLAETLSEGDTADIIPDEDIEIAVREAIEQSLRHDAPDVSDAVEAVRAALDDLGEAE